MLADQAATFHRVPASVTPRSSERNIASDTFLATAHGPVQPRAPVRTLLHQLPLAGPEQL